MRTFYLISFNKENDKKFNTLQELMTYYDRHSGIYTHYIFSIPLLGYFRRDELPNLDDLRIREKYKLGQRQKVINSFNE